jgi:hypothetical protein
MSETIVLILAYFNDFLRMTNPFLFFGATCLWVRLHWRTQNMLNKNSMRQYCIESQIDYIINHRDIDNEYRGIDRKYIDYLRNIYSGLEGKK